MSGPRFSFIPAAALRDKSLSKAAKLTIAALGMYTNEENDWVFPSQFTIGEMIGYSRETICRAISELEKAGYLEKRHRFHENGGQRSSEMRLLFDAHTPVKKTDTAPDEAVTPPSDAGDAHNVPINNKPSTNTGRAFREFWSEWTALSLNDPDDPPDRAESVWMQLDAEPQESAIRGVKAFQKDYIRKYGEEIKLRFAHRCLANGDLLAFASSPAPEPKGVQVGSSSRYGQEWEKFCRQNKDYIDKLNNKPAHMILWELRNKSAVWLPDKHPPSVSRETEESNG